MFSFIGEDRPPSCCCSRTELCPDEAWHAAPARHAPPWHISQLAAYRFAALGLGPYRRRPRPCRTGVLGRPLSADCRGQRPTAPTKSQCAAYRPTAARTRRGCCRCPGAAPASDARAPPVASDVPVLDGDVLLAVDRELGGIAGHRRAEVRFPRAPCRCAGRSARNRPFTSPPKSSPLPVATSDVVPARCSNFHAGGTGLGRDRIDRARLVVVFGAMAASR